MTASLQAMQAFPYRTVPEIVFGPGAAAGIGEWIGQRHEARRVLLVTDPGLYRLGVIEPVVASLRGAGREVDIFHDVEADPTEACVLAAIERARAGDAGIVVGCGGGSPMDVAKLAAAFARNGQALQDAYGVGRFTGTRLPLAMIPTTAGTGSEVTPIAIVTTGGQSKAGIVSPALYGDVAVLDPLLTLGLPPAITAATGIDAMVHALEAYTGVRMKNPLSDCAAREALRLLGGAITTAFGRGDDVAARGRMLLGSMLAGQAFANSPVGGVHALAYPVGSLFHVPHGVSNALMLGPVLRHNLDAACAHYAELADILVPGQGGSEEARARGLLAYFESLSARMSVPTRLSAFGVAEADIAMLAESAMTQQRLLVNNPRPIGAADAERLYREAL